ncbi:hypothetical protein BYT27DRAFT_7227722 [Phlegmacium glaucopus]|nr:hypothetical protein BYT27DRAFT_7227722 [Phlegmacium glaucopus]
MDEETAAFLFMQETEECEADAADQEFNVHLAAALQPNPQTDTAWQVLFNSQNDCAYITTMGFNVETFELIVQSGFGEHWYTQPIPHTNSSSHGEPHPGARSLDEWGALGLILHYLNSTMLGITLQRVFALIPATTSCYITFGLKLIVAHHPQLEGAFASIDGLNLPTQTSDDPDIENATYNRWLSEHYISSVIVFSPCGVIIAANFNAPGSWHDSHVAQPIYEKLHNETPDGFYLVADSAFPCGTVDIEGCIMAPIKTGQRLQGTIAEIEERFAYDRELLSYRQTAEWGMQSIQADLLEICFRLHNLRTRRVGVYMSEWRKTLDDEEVWMSFESIVFGDQ